MEEIGNAKSDLMDPNAVRAPPTDAELKIAALQGMYQKLKKNEKSEGAAREWSTVVIVIVIFIS